VVGLVVLSPNGVTGHPDHRAVTAAAERVADLHGVITIEWGVDPATAAELRERYGLAFFAIDDGDDVFDVHVSRDRQLAAVQCHRSQLDKDPVVLRRLAIQGDRERVRIRQPQRGNPS
jgi:LmbE family N-acetylglucosaminyl deacetylase